jgi:hypothetical protein
MFAKRVPIANQAADIQIAADHTLTFIHYYVDFDSR